MSPTIHKTLNAQGIDVRTKLSSESNNDYISLTDIAKYVSDSPADTIKNWLRGQDVIEYLGLWEQLHNPDFKLVEFDGFKTSAGRNAFTMSPQKWIAQTNAIGIISRSGRYGGTYAHSDIAFKFAAWLSPEFELYLIKEYQRLKEAESAELSSAWNIHRLLAKTNYKIHTDAIKAMLVPPSLTTTQKNLTYASEADVINMALFNTTAKEWRAANPDVSGNIRDTATIQQLIVLSNLESLNAELIRAGLSQIERLERLRSTAITQLQSLASSASAQKLASMDTPQIKSTIPKN